MLENFTVLNNWWNGAFIAIMIVVVIAACIIGAKAGGGFGALVASVFTLIIVGFIVGLIQHFVFIGPCTQEMEVYLHDKYGLETDINEWNSFIGMAASGKLDKTHIDRTTLMAKVEGTDEWVKIIVSRQDGEFKALVEKDGQYKEYKKGEQNGG